MNVAIQTKLLKRQRSPGEYATYRAALEWDLEDPIVIEKREDLKSEYRWGERLKPYHHQVGNLMTFCRRLPVTLLADDVGLGKTISAGLVMSELIARSRLQKILVVCPKLLGPQWKEELETKFDIPTQVAVGREVLEADPEEVGAVVTTYASARLHLEAIPKDRFQMLILDEAHKLRNLYGVETPPQVAKKFRKALEERRFRFVLMLTATPIHNRLWDLYSLVDLLTVARGHQNPFGSEGAFARKFIADSREQARQLKVGARDEFRSIVYGYMSRVRRGDAKLYFPEREVQLHRVNPTSSEIALIKAIAQPIQKLNRLAQISILQALASSPDALSAQLNNMARNGTVPAPLAALVREIVASMPLSAKLEGLRTLIGQLRKEDENRWRLVVFTTRVETQTTIQTFLESYGLKVGIINGMSGARNQETIGRFRREPPDCHVIVSTEAGAEGVNLQVANVLVNFDLPWNPMIVEQRIGRVQRLASKHAKVGIFNIILQGTFEEYIVGRLMEKLQMASHAIGDIDALLEGSGISDEDEGGAVGFEERIRQLVVASLSGKNVELETRQAAESIQRAKEELEREQGTINDLLGDPAGSGYVGPRGPALPPVVRSMAPREFTLSAFPIVGAHVLQVDSGVVVEENGGEEFIHFEGETPKHPRSSLYAQGSPGFASLVSRIVATGVHNVRDMDEDPGAKAKTTAMEWARRFASSVLDADIRTVRRHFVGNALVRIRATVAHDSYERLVEVACSGGDSNGEGSRSFIAPLAGAIDDPRAIGIELDQLEIAALSDEGIGEFRRFYIERRELEIGAAGDDERKRKKLEDDFTPRLEMSLVGLEGAMSRDVTVHARYKLDDVEYASTLMLRPSTGVIVDEPQLARCGKSGRDVPIGCLKECQISGARVIQHLLVQSQKSRRSALPDYVVTCAVSGKRLLKDEAEASSVTGKLVDKDLLKMSAASGAKAEAEHFGHCEFTKGDFLKTELSVSEISGKTYRLDQRRQSAVSGKKGHKDEFVACAQTGNSLALREAEQCDVTGKHVQPGILEACAVTGKRVLPDQLERCEVSGKRALKSEIEACQVTGKRVLRSELARCAVTGRRVLPDQLRVCDVTGKRTLPSELERCAVTGKRVVKEILVSSSESGIRILEEAAIRSATGKFCAPAEAVNCEWSSRRSHPSDLRDCRLTGLRILYQFAGPVTKQGHALQPLLELLDGTKRNADHQSLWPGIAQDVSTLLGGSRCQVEAAILSPSGSRLATSVEVRTLFGFRTRQAGLLYETKEKAVVGRISQGQRKASTWLPV